MTEAGQKTEDEMGRKSREKKMARAKFRPETIGYIEGLRLAAWMADKSPGMMEMYRSENAIAGPVPVRDAGPPVAWNDKKRSFREIVDPRDPTPGYWGGRVVMRALALELALKQIATLAHDGAKGALCTHDLSQLWSDIPLKTREELETRLQKKLTVVRVAKDGSGTTTRERPPSIEKICNENQNVFVHARYICEEKPRGEGELIEDGDIRGVLRFLSYWIMEKIGDPIRWQPADDASLDFRYVPSPNPGPAT